MDFNHNAKETSHSKVAFKHDAKFDRVWLAIHAWESHKAGTEEAAKVEAEIQNLMDIAHDEGVDKGFEAAKTAILF